jgi:hypothetical protein
MLKDEDWIWQCGELSHRSPKINAQKQLSPHVSDGNLPNRELHALDASEGSTRVFLTTTHRAK